LKFDLIQVLILRKTVIVMLLSQTK